MKSTESIDETPASTGRSLADGDAVSPSQTSLMDQRRRRLVRGAMAVAPLVLTLRSGALAAASCTGTKIGIGVATTTDTGKIKSSGTSVKTGLRGKNDFPDTPDYCFKSVDSCSDAAAAAEGKINTQDISDLSVPVYRTGIGSETRFYCGGIPDGSPKPDKQFTGQTLNFAILSSASASSLIARG